MRAEYIAFGGVFCLFCAPGFVHYSDIAVRLKVCYLICTIFGHLFSIFYAVSDGHDPWRFADDFQALSNCRAAKRQQQAFALCKKVMRERRTGRQ